jgi:hypothetical protein
MNAFAFVNADVQASLAFCLYCRLHELELQFPSMSPKRRAVLNAYGCPKSNSTQKEDAVPVPALQLPAVVHLSQSRSIGFSAAKFWEFAVMTVPLTSWVPDGAGEALGEGDGVGVGEEPGYGFGASSICPNMNKIPGKVC